MTSFALLLLAAAVAMGAAKRLRLPPAPLLVVAGVLLRVSGIPMDGERVQEALLLSATFLLFALGTELDLGHLRRHGQAAAGVAIGQLALLVGAGVLAGRLVGLELPEVLHASLAVSASSSLLAIEVLRRRQRVFDAVGRLVIGVLLLQDFMVMSGVAILGGLAGGPLGLAQATGAVALLALAALLMARWGSAWLILKLKLDDEQVLLVALSVLFVFLGAAFFLGLPVAVGAFFGGVSLSRFPVSGLVRAKVSSFSDFFVATFYVALGALISLPGPEAFVLEGALVLTLVVLAPLALLPVARSTGLTTRDAVQAVTLLGQCGELAMIVGAIALSRGDLSERMFGVIVTVSVVTMLIAPWVSSDRATTSIVRWIPGGHRRLAELPSGHVLWIGAGAGSRPVIAELARAKVALVVVEGDPGAARDLEREGIRVLRGDGGDPRVLEAAGLTRARLVVSTMRSRGDNERLVRMAREASVPVWVRVFSSDLGARMEALGARVFVESEAGLEGVLGWVDALRAARAAER